MLGMIGSTALPSPKELGGRFRFLSCLGEGNGRRSPRPGGGSGFYAMRVGVLFHRRKIHLRNPPNIAKFI